MIVFNGMMAFRSATWGYVASLVGIPAALVLSALCLFIFDLATARWRIPSDEVFIPRLSEPLGQGPGN